MVLGGNFDVLSTEIFFAIVGAQNDQGRAAVLALVLLTFTLLVAFWAPAPSGSAAKVLCNGPPARATPAFTSPNCPTRLNMAGITAPPFLGR